MSSSHTVIPPIRYPDQSPSRHSIDLMAKKLEAAEKEAKLLLGQIGKSSEKFGRGPVNLDQDGLTDVGGWMNVMNGAGNLRNADTVLMSHTSDETACETVGYPPKGHNPENDDLPQNYSDVVSRMCRTESSIQTLKLNLLNLRGNYDLKKKLQLEAEEKFTTTMENYNAEVNKLKRELFLTKEELAQELESKSELEVEVKDLKSEIEASYKAKIEAEALVEGIGDTKVKYNRKLVNLREDLTREATLRQSLEDSHNSLLTRIREMELSVEAERMKVSSLTEDCGALKAEVMRAHSDLEKESQTRSMAESRANHLDTQLGERQRELTAAHEERQAVREELNKLQGQYQELIKQLELMEQLMHQHTDVNGELQSKNQRLKEALELTSREKDETIAQQNLELETERARGTETTRLEKEVTCLRVMARDLKSDKQTAEQDRERLENDLMETKSVLASREREFKQSSEALEAELASLRNSLQSLEREKERSANDKETLLEEVNQAVDGMSDARLRLETDFQQVRVELKSVSQTKEYLEQENTALQERLQGLANQESAQKKVESTLRDMLEQKNKLAYEKGRLQSHVGQLQGEVESLAKSQTEAVQLQKLSTTLENKYSKSQREISVYKLKCQHLENQLRSVGESADRKEKDFTLALRSRDEAIKEAQTLMEHAEAVEEREKSRVASVQKSLDDAKGDSKKMAATLEAVVASHTQLQSAVENLQTELGKKDMQLSHLKSDRSRGKQSIRELKREADVLKERLVAMETLESNEIEPLRKALEKCREDNRKMASSLEEILDSNSQLQSSVTSLQSDMERKSQHISKLTQAREKEHDGVKQEFRMYEERLDNLQDQLRKERDKTIKKSNKDVAEMRKQSEELAAKNGELSRANMELRHRLSEQDYALRDLAEKVVGQKTKLDQLTRAKRQVEENLQHLQAVRAEIDDLEKVRDEYMKKNIEQSRSIESLVGQIASLQSELRLLAQAQSNTQDLVKRKDEEVDKERRLRQDMAHKYKDSIKNNTEADKHRREYEEKIKLANEESLEISRHLEDAHEWFKTKFDTLQYELVASRQAQEQLERENENQKRKLEQEQWKAQSTAERAKDMIKVSRQTISRLGDYANMADTGTQAQIAHLQKQLNKEKDGTKYLEKKHKKLKKSSSKQLESLIKEYNR